MWLKGINIYNKKSLCYNPFSKTLYSNIKTSLKTTKVEIIRRGADLFFVVFLFTGFENLYDLKGE